MSTVMMLMKQCKEFVKPPNWMDSMDLQFLSSITLLICVGIQVTVQLQNSLITGSHLILMKVAMVVCGLKE
eukprot:8243714-Ditylum_brightwellii.AAC.1